MPNPDTYGIYLHIPYCRSKCRYCDFYSAPGTRGVPDEYVTALLRELSKSSRRPDTLYFGGGTPALLRPDQVHRLIKAAAPLPGAEITLEANPDVVTPENLAGFAAAGVTRISFGVQSADDAQLRRLGRTHTAAAAAQAFAWAREAGFREICGDIMLALPYYSIAEFDKTLALLQAGGCTHISAYLLKIEPGTAFGRNPPPGLPDADAAAEFYLYAVQRLAQEGYRQYEISNFACPGHEGRHNLLYWNCKDYWGIGPAAHSCLGSVRRFWPNDTAAFIAGTVQEQYEGPCNAEDYLIMQLRLCSGLNLTEYAARYGVRFDAGQMAFLRHCAASGYAVLDGDTLRLTPSGMIVQNAILEELKMTGMVSDEEEIIQLLDKDFTDKSKVLPVAKKKDGSFTQASSVLSQEDFHVVSDYVNHKIRELGSEILAGDIALNPYKQTKGNACTYCSYRSICGFDGKLGADLVRELQDMDQEEALDEMKKELEEEPWQ